MISPYANNDFNPQAEWTEFTEDLFIPSAVFYYFSVYSIHSVWTYNSLPFKGGLGRVSYSPRPLERGRGWGLHPCGTRDTLPKRVPALCTKAMWHPCTLKMKISRARAEKIINIVDKPETWNPNRSAVCKVDFPKMFARTLFLNTLTENRGEKSFFKGVTLCQSAKNA